VKTEQHKYKSANERELMAIFNCDPAWPVCLFDFSFKSKIPSFLSFRVGHDLTSFVNDDYFYGVNQRASGRIEPDNALTMKSQNDLLIERNMHLCQNPLFVANFKQRFIANDQELLRN
jgi:hypothetical protein